LNNVYSAENAVSSIE